MALGRRVGTGVPLGGRSGRTSPTTEFSVASELGEGVKLTFHPLGWGVRTVVAFFTDDGGVGANAFDTVVYSVEV